MKDFLLMKDVLLFVWTCGAVARRLSGSGSSRTTSTDVGGAQHALTIALNARQAAAEKSWELRICNAYAFESGLDAFHSPLPAVSAAGPRPGPTRLTHDSGPLPYKHCADFSRVEGLGDGSVLSFRLSGGLPIGAFRVDGLPSQGTLLQIVAFRYDTSSTAAGFSSHVFGEGSGPEVALVDAYRGSASSGLAMRSTASRWQDLRFGRAVGLKPGWYEWALTGDHTRSFHGGEVVGFRMSSRGRYTAMRVGVDASNGPRYQEELVLFPTSWITVYSQADRAAGGPMTALLLSLGLSTLLQQGGVPAVGRSTAQ
uniref:Uncharacterized protein n=1 Tax=Alexandrium monilatum TaxID=311494 RepID=A0A7S4RRV2_9DINO|mmetsp:Transcript_34240/g.102293  ORF Transcript_34240/g.102293 Transcript_34240/m.102293 type:complete len:312 (+) Transcript_34240:174-1109(+)